MTTQHYLRFAKALVLGAVLPACSASSTEPTPSKSADSAETTGTSATEPSKADDKNSAPAPVAAQDPKADAGSPDVDAALPFSSGPLCPPELPAGFERARA